MTAAEYIAQYKDIAISEMKRMGVPAAISLAQGLLETENGNSDLVKRSNNHFGIKCKSSWTAESYKLTMMMHRANVSVYIKLPKILTAIIQIFYGAATIMLFYSSWIRGIIKHGLMDCERQAMLPIPNIRKFLLKILKTITSSNIHLTAVDEVPVFDASKYTDDPEDKTPKILHQLGLKNNQAANQSESASIPLKLQSMASKALLVPKGTSLLAVASQNNINLGRLLDINDLKKDGLLEKDQYIFLEKKQKQGNKDYYMVQHNESLYDDSTRKWNHFAKSLSNTIIFLLQMIFIRAQKFY